MAALRFRGAEVPTDSGFGPRADGAEHHVWICQDGLRGHLYPVLGKPSSRLGWDVA